MTTWECLVEEIKDRVRALFHVLGLEVRRIGSSPLPPPLGTDPREVIRRRNSHDPVALSCPLSECVEFNGLSLSPAGWHPFVRTAREYLQTGRFSYEGSCLERYYASWQPRNGREAVIKLAGPRMLEEYPAYTMSMPWSNRTAAECAAYMASVIQIENAAFGEASVSSSDGYGLHGPVSSEKGALEYKRLISLVDSILQRGYDRSRGDMTVQVLQRGGSFRYVVIHGHHRAAALAALGYTHMPAIPEVLVEREHSAHWPAVYMGGWTEAEALALLDHLFDFDSLAWAEEREICT